MEDITGLDHNARTGPSITVSAISNLEPASNVDICPPGISSVICPVLLMYRI